MQTHPSSVHFTAIEKIKIFFPQSFNSVTGEVKIQTPAIVDIPEIIKLMNSSPEVAFCEWEDFFLLERTIFENHSVNLIAKKGVELI